MSLLAWIEFGRASSEGTRGVMDLSDKTVS